MAIEKLVSLIEEILHDNEHFKEAIEAIDNSVPDKSHAIARVVEAKEHTKRVVLQVCYDLYVHSQNDQLPLVYDSTNDETL